METLETLAEVRCKNHLGSAGSPGNAMPGPFASGHKPCLGAGVESLFKAADW